MNIQTLKSIPLFIVLGVAVVIIGGITLMSKDSSLFPTFLEEEISRPEEAVFYFSPDSGELAVGEEHTMELRMTASEGVTAIRSYLTFPSERVTVTEVVPTQGTFSHWFEQEVDNAAGQIRLQASEPVPGVRGETMVAEITFEVTGEGAITFAHHEDSLALKPDDTNILFAMTSSEDRKARFSTRDLAGEEERISREEGG